MEDLISVIVPIYNTGCYLRKCVESILSQDYENLEIILVDDGSTDGTTVHLCDELAEKNDCIHVIHKKNGGSSSARNVGVRMPKGNMLFSLIVTIILRRICYPRSFRMPRKTM